MASLPLRRYTPEKYLELERKAEHRSEYVNGEILAMAGASREHNLIVTNLVREVSMRLRNKSCETYSNDMRVKINSTRFTYPDVVIVCQKPNFADGYFDMPTNPTVILEVLSPSTENDDRSWKFAHCRRLPSLVDYVLVSQYQPVVEHYTRHEMDLWILQEVSGLSGVLHLPSLHCELPLSEIYDRIEFTPELPQSNEMTDD